MGKRLFTKHHIKINAISEENLWAVNLQLGFTFNRPLTYYKAIKNGELKEFR